MLQPLFLPSGGRAQQPVERAHTTRIPEPYPQQDHPVPERTRQTPSGNGFQAHLLQQAGAAIASRGTKRPADNEVIEYPSAKRLLHTQLSWESDGKVITLDGTARERKLSIDKLSRRLTNLFGTDILFLKNQDIDPAVRKDIQAALDSTACYRKSAHYSDYKITKFFISMHSPTKEIFEAIRTLYKHALGANYQHVQNAETAATIMAAATTHSRKRNINVLSAATCFWGLKEINVNLNAANADKLTPLLVALNNESRWQEVIPALLNAGADINHVQPTTGVTPLHHAAGHGTAGQLKMLLDNNANPDILTKNGANLLDLITGRDNAKDLFIALKNHYEKVKRHHPDDANKYMAFMKNANAHAFKNNSHPVSLPAFLMRKKKTTKLWPNLPGFEQRMQDISPNTQQEILDAIDKFTSAYPTKSRSLLNNISSALFTPTEPFFKAAVTLLKYPLGFDFPLKGGRTAFDILTQTKRYKPRVATIPLAECIKILNQAGANLVQPAEHTLDRFAPLRSISPRMDFNEEGMLSNGQPQHGAALPRPFNEEQRTNRFGEAGKVEPFPFNRDFVLPEITYRKLEAIVHPGNHSSAPVTFGDCDIPERLDAEEQLAALMAEDSPPGMANAHR
jgi:hypothetical protein